ncbi:MULTISPECIES: sialate O-acetylesterase [unclassified Dysgonomonas]|uniref:sialate O-acetylesterase n=1 Tax=unclassified Dysgonomonas TaxID=2630389 RepID=UPI0025C135BB|nr:MULTISPECIES: sialate O-acetylesterase [unclassified Dysgonomonas]HMM01406.1 sialate O-acetylesterase [Dysgonomonas sp.]
MKKPALLLSLMLILSISVQAQLKLPSIFGNNMLLQQNTNINMWGWSEKGKPVEVDPSWADRKYSAKTDDSGKWTLQIPTPAASNDVYTITVSDGKDRVTLENILIGEVWLCLGQSNMEMPMKGFKNQPVEGGNKAIFKSKNKNIRIITVKRTSELEPQDNFIGEWQEATPETVKEFSATGYYFGRLLNETLDVPVGLILSSWGGSWIESWMSRDILSREFKEVKLPDSMDDIKEKNRTPTTLYNGMIHPVKGYTINGAIMYQGESNYDRASQYPRLFQTFIKETRKIWGQGEFPFYYCQIAPYNNPPEKHGDFNAAFLREAQYKSAQVIPNSGMVVLMDIGEENCIHPRNKEVGGERLAMMALAKTYGMSGFAYESPTFKEMAIEGGKAVLSFDNAPMWLTAYGKELKNFEIAGEDRVFYPAKAEIKRSRIEVSSDKVGKPVAVRYGFKDFVVGDLFSTEGLPLSSFRTDNWDDII